MSRGMAVPPGPVYMADEEIFRLRFFLGKGFDETSDLSILGEDGGELASLLVPSVNSIVNY